MRNGLPNAFAHSDTEPRINMPICRALVPGCLALQCALTAAAVTTTVVDIPSRNATQRFLYVHPDSPIANVIVLPGSDGELGIRDDGSMVTQAAICNPVARNRQAFGDHRLALALVDATTAGSVRNFIDVQAVIQYVQARDNVPTWLIGGSSSTTAIWDLAVNLPSNSPVGAIFFSPEDVGSAQAGLIRRPTQVVTDAGDIDPSGTAGALYSGLTAAPARERVVLTGGSNSGCGYHLFNGIDGAFVATTTGFIERYNTSFGPPGPSPNQHGLTGVWYEPATSGQGFALEVFPDLIRSGTGFIAGGWFTFSGAPAGGADGQRWYSVSGSMAQDATSSAVTIYQNVGGDFDAPPVTPAQTVGTGTLSFATCDTGQLSYWLADGRTGIIPLSRATPNSECSMTSTRFAVDDFGFSGNWYNPSTSGQGLVVEVNGASDSVFFAWYTYAPNSAATGAAGQRWYTGQGMHFPSAHTMNVALYQTVGGAFDTPTPPTQATTAVGTATLTFASCTTASLAYAFTGGTSAGHLGTIALQRAGPPPSGCVF